MNTSANPESSIPKQFDYQEAEKRIYSFWEKLDAFHAEVDPEKKPFCVVIPPPNVTGILHMGHILDNIPQDVMTRWHRMRGFSAVWIPGTDHAGIATQNVVKRQLAKEGVANYRDLGREVFLKRVWEWREKHGGIIIEQLKRLGCSCDWRRERFTMDQGLSRAVLAAFVHYYEKGLIYKGKRMINWCTVCGTALANDEVEHSDHNSHLWHLRYPILQDDGTPCAECVVVATTRPETMLGDTAVAVNPKDERYLNLVGKRVFLPLQERSIPVIADSFVDPSFGTGVVKVTPAHDPNDYEMGLKHGLQIIAVIGQDGTMTPAAGRGYAGQDRFAARKKVVQDLETRGFLEKIENYKHSVGECYRCHSVLEPYISDQWFVRMRPLAEKAKQAVADGRIQIIPESEKRDYFHWMDTIQDWCISRQLWWGHRIPIYYCGQCAHVMAKVCAPQKCDKCGSERLSQDEDVLDTWFSSQLWPFSTLGWPDRTPDLKYWYPNTWLMSGRDILFFWDVKMIMAGLELVGDVPFRTLALHGIVRDEKGRKLSKSLGNSPDPLELFEKYGTDAVRAAITVRYPMGRQDTRLSAEEPYRNGQALITKIWNASRFLLMNLAGAKVEFDSREIGAGHMEDRWVLSRLKAAIAAHDAHLGKSDILHAFQTVSDFFWNEYCDWYLEIIKNRMRQDGEIKRRALAVALHCERTLLKLLHPYIPFVTEDLWQILRRAGVRDSASAGAEESISISAWPSPDDFEEDKITERKLEIAMSLVRAVRDVRHHLVIAPKAELRIKLFFFEEADAQAFSEASAIARNLGFVDGLESYSGGQAPAGHVPCRFEGGIGYVEIPSEVDPKDLKSRLHTKIAKLEKALAGVNQRLNNPSFVENAPPELVQENKNSAAEYSGSLRKLQEFFDSL